MKRPIYVIGHKNPDTDSIISAIAYAEYKKHLKIDAVAVRNGSTNSETEYLLDRFGFEEPTRMYSARSLLKEIDIDKANIVFKDMLMKDALDLILKTRNRSLVVCDKAKHLLGLVSLGDLTNMWTLSDEELAKLIKTIKIENVAKVLDGTLVCDTNKTLSGHMHIYPSVKSKVHEGSIVLLRNENEMLKFSIEKNAALIIVVISSSISDEIIKLAKKNNCAIITTSLSPLTVTRLIFQAPTVEQIMCPKKKAVIFKQDESVQEASKRMAKSRHRSYPVLNDEDKVIGAVSRYHLFNYQKKRFILVDHNEYKQTIDDIDDGEILEIVDHHRFGGFETENPINIITMPVGATATIIANMFIENRINLDSKLAGLLLGAIISDTMNFKSPTTTTKDIEISKKLEKISKVKANELSSEMIKHSDSLLSKRLIEIVFNDFKEFNIDGTKVGLGQSLCKSIEEFEALKDSLQQYLNDSSKTGSYDLLGIMLTNPNGSGSYLLASGSKKHLIDDIYGKKMKNCFVKGLVSRKKQLLPSVIKEISK